MEKICKYCHIQFSKPKEIGLKAWGKREFCTRACVDSYQREFGGWTFKTGYAKCSTCNGDMSYRPGYTKLKHIEKRICKKCRSIGKGQIGKEHWNYKNYLTKAVYEKPNEAWSKRVKNRDKWRCTVCGSDKNIEAHHILPRKTHPEKALEIDNGATVCRDCHWLIYKNWIGISYPFQGGVM